MSTHTTGRDTSTRAASASTARGTTLVAGLALAACSRLCWRGSCKRTTVVVEGAMREGQQQGRVQRQEQGRLVTLLLLWWMEVCIKKALIWRRSEISMFVISDLTVCDLGCVAV